MPGVANPLIVVVLFGSLGLRFMIVVDGFVGSCDHVPVPVAVTVVWLDVQGSVICPVPFTPLSTVILTASKKLPKECFPSEELIGSNKNLVIFCPFGMV